MPGEYRLLFDDKVYADLVGDEFDAARWMNIPQVLTSSNELPRSRKKLEELCRKRVVLVGDILTMRMTMDTGTTVSFSATVGKIPR